jgi:hypothetical protein
VRDEHEHTVAGDHGGNGHGDPFAGECPVRWLVEDIGRFLAGDDAQPAEVGSAGRQALTRAANEVNDLLRSAYAAHEVVATELRFAGPQRGFRRTVFALSPTPAALMLLAMRMCDTGDDVTVLQHTAAQGTSSRHGQWPFGMAEAERLTRPPGGDDDIALLVDPGEAGT